MVLLYFCAPSKRHAKRGFILSALVFFLMKRRAKPLRHFEKREARSEKREKNRSPGWFF